MSIKSLFGSKNTKYAGSFRRSSAAAIDMTAVLFLRIIAMEILGNLWLNPQILKFAQEFREKFGTETPKNTQEHIDYIIHSSFFIHTILFYAIVIFVGALYHAYLNSSSWRGTLGKRWMRITIVNKKDEKIGFGLGLSHYFLSVLPFAFVLYLISFQLRNDLTFFQAVTASSTNVFLGIMFLIWVQIHLFTKNKNTAYDMICQTSLINAKTAAKWPWSKTE
jgi:uncharacterized RDD family membrane protein YckC